MADLSLTDALTDSVPDVEDVVERDFVATLESETFDDQVGETVGKTDFIPLLDNDGKGVVNPLDTSGLISAPWPETQGDVQTHQTDRQAFETDFITGSMSGLSQSSPSQMIDSSPLEPFSGLSEPGVTSALNTGVSPVPLQTEKPSEPQESPASTEMPKTPAEPLLAMTPKSPLDTSAGVFGERWSDEAGIPSDLPFTPSVSTVISRHASHLADAPHDTPDPQWSPRDSGAGDEREGEGSDRKKDKKKKKRRPRDEMYDFHTELQSESASSESPHHSSPRKERDRDGGWEDVGRIGGRVKKPKSRKKIPEEWAIHAEPFVPASASVPQEFGGDFTSTPTGVDSSLISLADDYTDESLIPLSLTQDLLSLTAASQPSTLPKSPGQLPLSVSSGFHEINMETDSSAFQDYPKDAFELPSPLGKADSLACGMNETQSFTSAGESFEEAMFDQEHPYTGSLESPLKEPQMSTPASTCFVPPMEALISAPPFSPSGPAWSINNHNQPFDVVGVEDVAIETQVPKQNKIKQGKKSRSSSSSSKSPTTPDAKLPSPQNSGLNPAAPPFFPSFVEPREHVEGTVLTLEENKPEVKKTDNLQKSDNFDVFRKVDKDEKMVDEKDKTEQTNKLTAKGEKRETPDEIKEATSPDKSEKTDQTEIVCKVETLEKVNQLEKPTIKDVSEKNDVTEKPADKKETKEKTESTPKMEKEKLDQVEKTEVKTKEVKADENKSDLKSVKDTAEDNKLDLKQENDNVEKTECVKAEQKTVKVEPADKKSAKAEKDDKDEKAKKPAAKLSAAKTAVSNGAPAKDLSSLDKKTKPVAGATKPGSAKPRPSSATAAPKRPTATSSISAPAPLSKKAPVPKAPTPSAGTKRPSVTPARPSGTTSSAVTKEVKPKTATEKRPPVPKVTSAPARPAAPKNDSNTTAENKPANTTRTSATTRLTASAPAARRTATKTESKPEEKKAAPPKTSTDAARFKATPLRTSTTASASTRPRPTKTPSSGSTTAAAPAEKKPLVPRTPRPNPATASAAARPGSAPASDMKNIRSKIGSTDNIKYQPGGGKVTVSQNRTEAQSKDSSQGKIQILSKKVDVSKVTSKCGSKANLKHKPGGGDIKIESHKVNFKDKAHPKIGSMDNVNHAPGGGKIKAEGAQETAEGSDAPSSGVLAAQPAAGSAQENGLKEGSVPCRSDELRDPQGLDSLIPETN